jgi:hypothetical protein
MAASSRRIKIDNLVARLVANVGVRGRSLRIP